MRWISVEYAKSRYYFNEDLLERVIVYSDFVVFGFGGSEYTLGTGIDVKGAKLQKHGAVKLSESTYVWPERLTGFWLKADKRPLTFSRYTVPISVSGRQWLLDGKLRFIDMSDDEPKLFFAKPESIVAIRKKSWINSYQYALSHYAVRSFFVVADRFYDTNDYIYIRRDEKDIKNGFEEFWFRPGAIQAVAIGERIEDIFVLASGAIIDVTEDVAKEIVKNVNFKRFADNYDEVYVNPDAISVRLDGEPQSEHEVKIDRHVIDLKKTNAIIVTCDDATNNHVVLIETCGILENVYPLYSRSMAFMASDRFEAEVIAAKLLDGSEIVELERKKETATTF